MTGDRLDRIGARVALVGFALLRLASARSPVRPRIMTDSADYYAMAQRSLPELVVGSGVPLRDQPLLPRVTGRMFPLVEKPPATSMLFKAVGSDPDLLVFAHVLLGAAAWGWLAVALSGWFPRRTSRAIAFVGVLAAGLSTHAAIWDHLVMSDSLSASALVATLAALLQLLRQWSTGCALALIAVATIFGATRDANAVLLCGVAAVVVIGVLVGGLERRWLAPAAALAVLFLVSAVSASANERHLVALYHLVSKRVLLDEDLTAEMLDRGMPDSRELRNMAGRRTSDGYVTNPDLGSFHEWIAKDGQRAYIGLALSRPWWSLTAPFGDLDAVEDAPAPYVSRGYRAPLPGDLSDWLVAGHHWALIVHLGLGLAALRCADRRLAGAVAAMLAAGAGLVIVSWHGDANEIGRHAKDALLLVSMTAVAGVAVLAERSVSRSTSPGSAPGSGRLPAPSDRRPFDRSAR